MLCGASCNTLCLSLVEHSSSSHFKGAYDRELCGIADGIGTQILLQPECMESVEEDAIANTKRTEERNDDESDANYDGDKDFDVGREGQPRLKKVL